jgi:hypothetical protein
MEPHQDRTVGRTALVGYAAVAEASVNAERRVFDRVTWWMEAALRPALIAGAILGFAGGLWIVLTCETGCWPLIGNILAVVLYAGLGAFVLYCAIVAVGVTVLVALVVIAWLYHGVFRDRR